MNRLNFFSVSLACALLASCVATSKPAPANVNTEHQAEGELGSELLDTLYRDYTNFGVRAALSVFFGGKGHAAVAGATSGGRAEGHVWMPLPISSDRPWPSVRPRLFSYVVTGEIGGEDYRGQNEQILTARKNLQLLIAEIRGVDQVATSSRKPEVERLKRANVFLVPAFERSSPKARRGDFNHEIATSYRVRVTELLDKEGEVYQRMRGYGPFIVTTTAPINDMNERGKMAAEEVDLLLLDLSGVAGKSIPVYLSSFRRALENESMGGTRSFKSLRADTVSFLLHLNDSIPLVATATMSIPATARGIGR